MGRPIKKQKYFGSYAGVPAIHQIQSTTWGASDSGAVAGSLKRQNSQDRFIATTAAGSSLTTLSNGAPSKAGYSAVKVFPVGTDPTTYATGSAKLKVVSATLVSGGTGYSASDVLTIVGGTFTNAATITVDTVAAGVVATFHLTAVANQGYTALPSELSLVTVTGGGGTLATFAINFGLESVTVANGGAGYTGAVLAFPQATTAPTTAATVVGGVVQSAVTVSAAGVINVANPTIVFEGSAGTTEYLKYLQSRHTLVTFSGNVYHWLHKGQTPPASWATAGVKIAYLDTL